MDTYAMLINGRSVNTPDQDPVITPAFGEPFATCARATSAHVQEAMEADDPATEEPLADVPAGDKEDVDRAVRAARRAFEGGSWRRMTPSERGRALWKLADMIELHTEEFAQLEIRVRGDRRAGCLAVAGDDVHHARRNRGNGQ